MWKSIITLVILLITSIEYLKAQTGCLIGTTSTGTLYTDTDGFGFYQMGGAHYLTSAPACPRVQLGARVGFCEFSFLGTVYNSYTYTIVTASSSPVACSLNEYLLFVVGLYGVYRVRKFSV